MNAELVTMAAQVAGCIVVTVPVAVGWVWAVCWYADRRGR